MKGLINITFKGWIAVLVSAMLYSCSLFVGVETPNSDQTIKFTVSEWQEVKGSILSKSTIGSFGLFGYLFKSPWETSYRPDFIFNDEVTKASGWATKYYYPNDGRYLRFYAYAPYNCEGVTPSSKDAPGAIKLGYTVPSDVAAQKDLVVAMSGDILGKDASGDIELKFYHTLTGIRFETGSEIKEGIIKSISIKGVYTSATLVYGDGPSERPHWDETSYKSKGDFTVSLNKYVTSGVEGVPITGDDQIFMMLPHKVLPTGAALEIIFNDGTMDRTLTKKIDGLAWPQGEIITYKISTTSF